MTRPTVDHSPPASTTMPGARSGLRPDTEELIEWLGARGNSQRELFERARAARAERYDRHVVVRGLIEVTNRCRVNCKFCPMRRDNTKLNSGYLLSDVEMLDSARQIKRNDINIVFFQGGEVPQTTELLGRVIPQVRDLFHDEVEVLLCLGNKTQDEYAYLKAQGANSYILKHETSDPVLNESMREDSLERRLACLETLKATGYRVGTGAIVGLPGQGMASIAGDISLAAELGVDMISVAPFVPAPQTPLASSPAGDVDTALNFIAAARIVNPQWLIPSVSALEKNRPGGQLLGLRAGANVVTINFTPLPRREKYLIYGKERFVVRHDHVRELLAQARMTASSSTFA